MQTIQVQTPEGMRQFKFLPDAAAFKAAADAGEIAVGEEIVYRDKIALVIAGVESPEMLILDQLQMPNPMFGGGMGPEFTPPPGGWNAAPNGMQWSFTVNGQPVDPAQFMKGGPIGK